MSPDVNHNDSIASKEQSSLTHFRSLLESYEKTKGFQPDDKVLLKFLRSRDFDPEEALKVLIAYISAINDRQDIFTWNDDITKVNQSGVYYHYPVKNIDGSKIMVMCPGKWNPSEYSFQALMSQRLFTIETSLMDEDVQQNGFTGIVDMRGFGWTHIYNGLSKTRLISDISEKIVPWKRVSAHVIHESRLTDIGYSLIKPFYGEKLRSLIKFHGNDLEKLYQVVPKSHLPPSLGGTNQEFSGEYYDQLLMKHKDTILDSWSRFKVKCN